MKTKKCLTKRFKITGSGKILRRASGQNHYRAKKSGGTKRQRRKWIPLHPSLAKKIKRLM